MKQNQSWDLGSGVSDSQYVVEGGHYRLDTPTTKEEDVGKVNTDPETTSDCENQSTEREQKEAEIENEEEERKRKEKEMWDIVLKEDNRTPWSELKWWQILLRITWFVIEVALVVGSLYIFICSLDVLGDAFQLLGGRTAGKAFSQDSLLNNAVCGLMIGVVCTALLQSSSTTTSITVTMVGTGLISVQQAIPIIMGANIGTSVTSTIVSLGQAMDRDEFRRAFAGATVHDMFNWLSVLILLPIEVVSDMLYHLTEAMVKNINPASDDYEEPQFLKVITKPVTELIIKVDKKVVTAIGLDSDYQKRTLVQYHCKETTQDNVQAWPLGQENTTFVDAITKDYWSFNVDLYNRTANSTVGSEAETVLGWTDTVHNASTKCEHLFVGQGDMPGATLSEVAIGTILLISSLTVLLASIVLLVKVLQDVFKGSAATVVCKLLNANFPGYMSWATGYLAILIGCFFTILVQSSSVFTSIVTPLVGAGLITVERMFPLTLGANIGTTVTSILAAFTNDADGLRDALQIAFVHLMFNLIGIAIWYPVPFMRRAPLWLAKFLGNTTADYRWFPIVYLVSMFLLLPAVIFGLSLAGVTIMLAVLIPVIIFIIILVIINVIQRKKPHWLPKKLQTWDWLPLWLHSLQPWDNIFTKCCRCKCCRCCRKDEEEIKAKTDDDLSFTVVVGGEGLQALEEKKNIEKTWAELQVTAQNGHANPGFE